MTPTPAIFLYCSGFALGSGIPLLILSIGGWL
jgi:hypothetical protein